MTTTKEETSHDDDGEDLEEQLKRLSIKAKGDNVKELKSLQCCICQETCVHPVQLPCTHVFCYLCIKGVAARNNRCALCRQQIPIGFMKNPAVVDEDSVELKVEKSPHNWFYEAKRGGWWMYEQRTSSEIEKAYNARKTSVQVQISGFFYIIDLEAMVQYREGMSGRQRRIRRGSIDSEQVKGVAGINIKNSSNDHLCRQEHPT